jgi:Transposase, Mutator family
VHKLRNVNYSRRLRKRFRSSNLLERSLEEAKRRTKVIGRFPGETSCLSKCWAVLALFLAGARGLGLTDLEYKQVGPMKIARSHPEHIVSMPLTAGPPRPLYINSGRRSSPFDGTASCCYRGPRFGSSTRDRARPCAEHAAARWRGMN